MTIFNSQTTIFSNMKPTLLASLCLISIFLLSCKKEKEETLLLAHNYGGSLSFEYSRDFPDFSEIINMPVDITKNGTVTFGTGGSKTFSATDTLFDGNEPALKIQVDGTVEFQSASGRCDVINSQELVFVKVNSHIWGTMYIWIWDEDLQMWIEPPVGPHEFPFDYQDSYADGEMQFSLLDATSGDGSAIKVTLPDIEGEWTYGYRLELVVGLI